MMIKCEDIERNREKMKIKAVTIFYILFFTALIGLIVVSISYY